MKLVIEIDMSGPSFQDGNRSNEVCRILANIRAQVSNFGVPEGEPWKFGDMRRLPAASVSTVKSD